MTRHSRRRPGLVGSRVGRVGTVTGLATAVVLASAGTIAWGHFTTGGSGAGTASTELPVPVVLGAATPQQQLFPGGTADVRLTVSNPNRAHAHLASLALQPAEGTSGFSVDSGHADCALSALSYVSQDNGGAGWTVPGRVGSTDGTLAVTLPDAVAMAESAADACQGATFTVHLTVGP